jgi:hypothetical protein
MVVSEKIEKQEPITCSAEKIPSHFRFRSSANAIFSARFIDLAHECFPCRSNAILCAVMHFVLELKARVQSQGLFFAWGGTPHPGAIFFWASEI